MSTLLYRHYGRVFEVQAAPTADQANAFMAANEGWGVLHVLDSGVVLMAANDNKGVAVRELPADLRPTIEALAA